MQDLEQSIRERAYHLWIEAGCQDGNAEAHWLTAQREVLSASLGVIGRVTIAEQPPAKQSEKLTKAKVSRRKQRAA
jgi:Protein of unknown function (DUF2934)